MRPDIAFALSAAALKLMAQRQPGEASLSSSKVALDPYTTPREKSVALQRMLKKGKGK